MMNVRIGLLEDIAQFVRLTDEALLIVVFEQLLARSIDMMPVVSCFTHDRVSRRVMLRTSIRRVPMVIWRHGQVHAYCSQFQFPQVIVHKASNVNTRQGRSFRQGKNQSGADFAEKTELRLKDETLFDTCTKVLTFGIQTKQFDIGDSETHLNKMCITSESSS